jgi:hypothetical protein
MTLEKMTRKILTTSEHNPRIANWIISFGAQVPFFILNTTSSLISCQHYGEGAFAAFSPRARQPNCERENGYVKYFV